MGANVLKKQQKPSAARLKIAHNALSASTKPKTSFFIEVATRSGDSVDVIYIDQAILNSGDFDHEDWKCCRISLNNIVAFVQDSDLNKGNSGNGNAGGGLPLSFYLEENLSYVVKLYMEAGKEITHV